MDVAVDVKNKMKKKASLGSDFWKKNPISRTIFSLFALFNRRRKNYYFTDFGVISIIGT